VEENLSYPKLFTSEIKYALLLNKFPIFPYHCLIIPEEYQTQRDHLHASDLAAIYSTLQVLSEEGHPCLGFYNQGFFSGASQPHKHAQLVPLNDPLNNQSFFPSSFTQLYSKISQSIHSSSSLLFPSSSTSTPLPSSMVLESQISEIKELPFIHSFASLHYIKQISPNNYGQYLEELKSEMLDRLGLLTEIVEDPKSHLIGQPDELRTTKRQKISKHRVIYKKVKQDLKDDKVLNVICGPEEKHSVIVTHDSPCYNLLMTTDWMLIVPRKEERFNDISLNSLGFLGSILVKTKEQYEFIKNLGYFEFMKQLTYSTEEEENYRKEDGFSKL